METPRDPVASGALFTRARRVIPGGVNSPVRAFSAVGGTPRFLVGGQGAYVTDVDGNRYLDFVGAWGPAILGHADPDVVAAVQAAAGQGFSFGAPSPAEVALAEEVARRVEPVEQVRLVNSGTEAVMSAMRLARGYTGRDLVVKFAGCYHGHVDGLLAAAGSGAAALGVPGSAGVTAAEAANTIVLPYNDSESVERAFRSHGSEIACVITEAAAANMGVVPPAEGFNAMLAATCREYGALFVLDEVMTGFRVGPAGWWGAEGADEGWSADLYTFGKVIGGGLPLAAFGGRSDVMAMLAPEGPVYQAGTLSGNPVAVSCGLATLRKCDRGLYGHLDTIARRVCDLVDSSLDAAGVPHVVQRAGNLFSVFFSDLPSITNFAEAQEQHVRAYAAFFHSMLSSGISLPPSAFEAWFVSGAHEESDIERLSSALPAAARAAKANGATRSV